MFSKTLLVLCSQVFVVSKADIADKSCTFNGTYTKAAFQCENLQPDLFCAGNFPISGTDELTVGGNNERPIKCYENNKPNVKAVAMSVCAKQCGYCCESAQYDERYNCENAEYPQHFVSCDEVKEAQCKDDSMREFINDDCPKSCGFCNKGKCKDLSAGCLRSMCTNIVMQDFVEERCAFTCGKCDKMNKAPTASPILPGASTAGPIIPPVFTAAPQPQPQPQPVAPAKTCRDNNSACAAWVRNNFCTNIFYTDADRVKHCPASCGLCHMV